MPVDEFLPLYDVSDEIATVVEADCATVWKALMDADLVEVGRRAPLAGILGALRMLPEVANHLIHGERPPKTPDSMRLGEIPAIPAETGGWIMLALRPQDEIALGLVGKFWRPVIEFADVPAESFREFSEPGYAKTVYLLAVEPLDEDRTLLSAVMRTSTTDEHARRWFRRYWTFGVGSGAHVLVNGLLEMVRERAESANSRPD
jgi:hypothetical protein